MAAANIGHDTLPQQSRTKDTYVGLRRKNGRLSEKQAKGDRRIATHDTPPPTVISEGSLTIESQDELTLRGNATIGRWLHNGPKERPIAHLRVLHGNGTMTHEDLRAEGSVIKVELEDDQSTPAGDIIIRGNTDADPNSTFQIDGDQKLLRQGAGSRRRKHKYGHPGRGREFRVTRIAITKPGMTDIEIRNETSESQEYRILIWNVGHHDEN